MNQEILNKIESEHYRKEPLEFNVGDSVKVHTKVVEGERRSVFRFLPASSLGVVVTESTRPSLCAASATARAWNVYSQFIHRALKK